MSYRHPPRVSYVVIPGFDPKNPPYNRITKAKAAVATTDVIKAVESTAEMHDPFFSESFRDLNMWAKVASKSGVKSIDGPYARKMYKKSLQGSRAKASKNSTNASNTDLQFVKKYLFHKNLVFYSGLKPGADGNISLATYHDIVAGKVTVENNADGSISFVDIVTQNVIDVTHQDDCNIFEANRAFRPAQHEHFYQYDLGFVSSSLKSPPEIVIDVDENITECEEIVNGILQSIVEEEGDEPANDDTDKLFNLLSGMNDAVRDKMFELVENVSQLSSLEEKLSVLDSINDQFR